MNTSAKLSQQEKNQRAFFIWNWALKDSHDEKIAKSFKSIIKKLSKTTKVVEKSSRLETKNETPTQLATENRQQHLSNGVAYQI